jgi:hypothetical protein
MEDSSLMEKGEKNSDIIKRNLFSFEIKLNLRSLSVVDEIRKFYTVIFNTMLIEK